jgi:hypothetical protein
MLFRPAGVGRAGVKVQHGDRHHDVVPFVFAGHSVRQIAGDHLIQHVVPFQLFLDEPGHVVGGDHGIGEIIFRVIRHGLSGSDAGDVGGPVLLQTAALVFLPPPQGHGSLRPTFFTVMTSLSRIVRPVGILSRYIKKCGRGRCFGHANTGRFRA